MGASLLLAAAGRLLIGSSWRPAAARPIFWIAAFLLGAAGTTVLSRWRQEFVFTWPVSLFVVFEAAVYQIRFQGSREQDRLSRWRSRFIGLAFLASCAVYFLLCRRLSLVFEWVYLCGFAAATPFAVSGACTFRRRRWRTGWQCLMTIAAFSSFYWSSVGVLLMRA
jgi:hypothetical protein